MGRKRGSGPQQPVKDPGGQRGTGPQKPVGPPAAQPGTGPQKTAGAPEAREVPRSELYLQAYLQKDIGKSRSHNEDYVGQFVPPDNRRLAQKGAIYLAADGMGGHNAGEVASQGAVELTIGEYYADTTHDIGTSLVRAVRAANKQIYEWAQADAAKAGMGTTLVAAVVQGRKVFVANVGDSRAYLIRNGKITQITEDHSWVEEQVRAGLLSKEQARRHPQRNVVTRALGSKPSVEVDLFEGELKEGDILFLCTDGLTGHVEEQEIAAVVQEHPIQEAAQLLIDQANARGGSDNIGVVIVSAQEPPPTEVAPAPAEEKAARAIPLIPIMGGVAAVLAVVLVSLFVFRPGGGGKATATSVAMVASPATTTAVPEVTQAPTSEVLATPLPTEEPTLAPQETPGEPTATLAPSSTAAPTYTPRPPATNTPRPTNTRPARATNTPRPSYPPPTLVSPREEDAQALTGDVTFVWSYSGSLGEGEAFQVWMWRDNEPHLGAAEVWKLTSQTINLEGVPQLKQAGEYNWTVVVVEEAPPNRRLSPEPTPWQFRYAGPKTPGDGGGNGGGSDEPPPDIRD
jgi:serine/threonine protein phosphatase PrpC